MAGYLKLLTLRLAAGLENLASDERQRHTNFFLTAQRDDGGFAGREGESDLYYTGFGVRGLSLLGQLHDTPAQKAAAFLVAYAWDRQSSIDTISWIQAAAALDISASIDVFEQVGSDFKTTLTRELHALRRDDGGYARTDEGHASSTYQTFLILGCLQLLDARPSEAEKIAAFLTTQAAKDGGFHEIRVAKRAGTNPTAAAVGAFRLLNQFGDTRMPMELHQKTIDFILSMQTSDGGFRANTRIPASDLLSTFTALTALTDLDNLDLVDLKKVSQFVASLETDNGGFLGAAWDEESDVEYSMYGLGCKGLLLGALE